MSDPVKDAIKKMLASRGSLPDVATGARRPKGLERASRKSDVAVPIVDPNDGRVFSHKERELQQSLPKNLRGPGWKDTEHPKQMPGMPGGPKLKQPSDKRYWKGAPVTNPLPPKWLRRNKTGIGVQGYMKQGSVTKQASGPSGYLVQAYGKPAPKAFTPRWPGDPGPAAIARSAKGLDALQKSVIKSGHGYLESDRANKHWKPIIAKEQAAEAAAARPVSYARGGSYLNIMKNASASLTKQAMPPSQANWTVPPSMSTGASKGLIGPKKSVGKTMTHWDSLVRKKGRYSLMSDRPPAPAPVSHARGGSYLNIMKNASVSPLISNLYDMYKAASQMPSSTPSIPKNPMTPIPYPNIAPPKAPRLGKSAITVKRGGSGFFGHRKGVVATSRLNQPTYGGGGARGGSYLNIMKNASINKEAQGGTVHSASWGMYSQDPKTKKITKNPHWAHKKSDPMYRPLGGPKAPPTPAPYSAARGGSYLNIMKNAGVRDMNALEKYAAKRTLIEKMASFALVGRGAMHLAKGLGRAAKSPLRAGAESARRTGIAATNVAKGAVGGFTRGPRAAQTFSRGTVPRHLSGGAVGLGQRIPGSYYHAARAGAGLRSAATSKPGIAAASALGALEGKKVWDQNQMGNRFRNAWDAAKQGARNVGRGFMSPQQRIKKTIEKAAQPPKL